VRPDGRANPHQLVTNNDNLRGLGQLRECLLCAHAARWETNNMPIGLQLPTVAQNVVRTKKMKKVLLVTDGIIHPPLWGRMILHKNLAQRHGFAFRHTSSLEKTPADLESFSALVLHYHHKRISHRALKTLAGFVKQGGGILAIHAATASFKETLPYFEILGGRFIGHGPVEGIHAHKVREDIFEDAADF
jgi:hypothetical protein